MKPDKITVKRGFSLDARGNINGQWVSYESEATVPEGQTYPGANQALDEAVAAELRMAYQRLCAKRQAAAQAKAAQAAVGDEEIDEPPAPYIPQGAGDKPPAPPEEPESPPNWCEIHDCGMKRYTGKTGGTWHAHQTVDDESGLEYWCKGKPAKLCPIHREMMDQRDWGGFSHKHGDSWCHGKPIGDDDPDEGIPF